jgi:hypothetical protein
MLFDKPLSYVTFEDIQELSDEHIEESMILDYKQELNDYSIIKQVTAFSNTKGGYLVYGVTETGKGGYPQSINGIDSNFNKERLEQIILANIITRVSVQIKKIPIPGRDRILLVVYIPEGQSKPYYNNQDKRYYKRYNFSATPMDENEIEWLYQSRFFGLSKLERYIEEAIYYSQNKLSHEVQLHDIEGHVVITPLKIDGQMFDPSPDFGLELMKLYSEKVKDCRSYVSYSIRPTKFGIKWNEDHSHKINEVEIHKNGMIHSMKNCGSLNDENHLKKFDDRQLACNILQTIKFSSTFYSKVDYIGKVKIIVKIFNCGNSVLTNEQKEQKGVNECDSEEIFVERQWDSWRLEEDALLLAKYILDEISNYYGLWNSRLFYEDDGIIKYSI